MLCQISQDSTFGIWIIEIKYCLQRIIIVNENLFLKRAFWQSTRNQSKVSPRDDLLTWNLTKNSIVCVWYCSHQSLRTFAHATTALNSWHVQIFVVFWLRQSILSNYRSILGMSQLGMSYVLTETLPKCILRMIYRHGFKYTNYKLWHVNTAKI